MDYSLVTVKRLAKLNEAMSHAVLIEPPGWTGHPEEF